MDDHLFICLPHKAIADYNKLRESKARAIANHGGRIQEDGRWWFKGDILADGSHKEFTEDCSHPIRDPSEGSPGNEVITHAYDFKHINQISDCLGIPWEPSKDTPFSSAPVFIGFVWDIENKTVTLTPAKCSKYIVAIHIWLSTTAHTLEQVQKLHG